MTANGEVFPLDPRAVFAVVADAYGGLSIDELRSLRRWLPLPDARRVLCALLHDECRISWPRVAVLMGRQPGSAAHLARMATEANPQALETLRDRLRPPQRSLW